jgi:S-(hydroxymethyl)glutathione dehydrogenase/alcohol dehydrogenase
MAWCRKSLVNMTQPFTASGEPVWNFSAASVFSEYTVVQSNQCVKVGNDVDLAVLCVIGCGVLTGIGSVWNRTNLGLGSTCAVFGVGGIGLNVIQGARAKGASRIIAIDTLAGKEPLAREFGATDFLLTGPGDDVVTRVRELLPFSETALAGPFGAGGVDYAFECVGNAALIEKALAVLDWGGTVVTIGVPPMDATTPTLVASLNHVERTITGSRAGSHRPHYDIPLIVDLYKQGIVKLDELVSARYPLEDWEHAVHDLEEGKLARGVLQVAGV